MHKHQYVRKGLNYIEEREGCVDMAAGRLEWVGREERERGGHMLPSVQPPHVKGGIKKMTQMG